MHAEQEIVACLLVDRSATSDKRSRSLGRPASPILPRHKQLTRLQTPKRKSVQSILDGATVSHANSQAKNEAVKIAAENFVSYK